MMADNLRGERYRLWRLFPALDDDGLGGGVVGGGRCWQFPVCLYSIIFTAEYGEIDTQVDKRTGRRGGGNMREFKCRKDSDF